MSDNSSEHNQQGRRRRSRGGRGRNQQNRQSQNNPQRGGENRNRQPRYTPKKKPLTFWQKVLKFFGLYKEEEKPQRREERERPQFQQQQPIKSNTRNAKTGGGEQRQERGEKRQPRRPDPANVESGRLYIGNLSYDATEHDIEELFKGVGGVRSVEVVYNRRTHRSKGYGFVQMQNIEEARRAVEVLHDQFFMGRKLVVNAASSHGPRADDDDDSGEVPTKPSSEEQAA